jgi:hypothetical protein
MFDNRWDNWVGDFAESFHATLVDAPARSAVPEILIHFGRELAKLERGFPDEVSPESISRVLAEAMPRLNLRPEAKPHVSEVVARFFEYLEETGRLAGGEGLAAQIREMPIPLKSGAKTTGTTKGVTIRRSEKVPPLGRNDPCPCGSGKKFKKCCMGES